MSKWPPGRRGKLSWEDRIANVGRTWRENWNKRKPAPSQVQKWWGAIHAAGRTKLLAIAENELVTNSILQIVAAADQACGGVGVPGGRFDDLELHASSLLSRGGESSLCDQVDYSRCRVLPKMRTPQVGITLRSLTAHIALAPVRDVEPEWSTLLDLPESIECLNLLLIPWPFEVKPKHFNAADPTVHRLRNLPPEFGFFDYSRPSAVNTLTTILNEALDDATENVGDVHGVVFPELALTEEERKAVQRVANARGVFVVAGVQGKDREGRSRNFCCFDIPRRGRVTSIEQDKHHRWCLDRSQIVAYGLGGSLSPSRRWWETHVPKPKRKVSFIALDEWLTLTVLICEDLARQDPVAELVRSVGPNLVIALLMDGPQLEKRWPGRYASVLADDPGSSVLSFSSLGMVLRSRPPGTTASRVVGLWKDPLSGAVELELPQGAAGLVLSLSRVMKKEWMADGRHDDTMSGCPSLSGVHPVGKAP